MPAAVTAKICCICACDCAERDRTKDTKGRYFCMPCFKELLARKQRGETITLPPPPVPPSPTPPPTGLEHCGEGTALDLNGAGRSGSAAGLSASGLSGTGLSNTGLDANGGLAGVELAEEAFHATCPTCTAHLAAGSVICLRCGTNVRTGRRLDTRRFERRSTSWPTVLAVAATFAGAATITFAAVAAGTIVRGGAEWGPQGNLGRAGAVVLLVALGAVAAWHVVGAVGTGCRRLLGVHRLTMTSALWLGLVAIFAAGTISSTMVDIDRGSERSARLDLTLYVALALSAWPMAVACWTCRRGVRAETEMWT